MKGPRVSFIFVSLPFQCSFLAPIATSKMKDVATKQINRLISSSPSFQKLSLQLILTAPTFSLSFLPFLDCIISNYLSSKVEFPFKEYEDVMRLFSKSVLNGTSRPDYMVLESSTGIFKKVTRQLFEEILLPAMLKALLRNPDELTRGEWVSWVQRSIVM